MYIVYVLMLFTIFFFKQKTAYEMRISDWSSDVCSSDLGGIAAVVEMDMGVAGVGRHLQFRPGAGQDAGIAHRVSPGSGDAEAPQRVVVGRETDARRVGNGDTAVARQRNVAAGKGLGLHIQKRRSAGERKGGEGGG